MCGLPNLLFFNLDMTSLTGSFGPSFPCGLGAPFLFHVDARSPVRERRESGKEVTRVPGPPPDPCPPPALAPDQDGGLRGGAGCTFAGWAGRRCWAN